MSTLCILSYRLYILASTAASSLAVVDREMYRGWMDGWKMFCVVHTAGRRLYSRPRKNCGSKVGNAGYGLILRVVLRPGFKSQNLTPDFDVISIVIYQRLACFRKVGSYCNLSLEYAYEDQRITAIHNTSIVIRVSSALSVAVRADQRRVTTPKHNSDGL